MTKPGVDWPEIERQVKAGVSMRQLEKQHDISHQSISDMAARQGWKKSELVKDLPREVRDTETVKRVVAPRNRREGVLRVRTPARMVTILKLIRQGVSPSTAAAHSGTTPDTLSKWRQADERFDELIKQCEMAAYADDELSIVKARDRGDWKAAESRLKRAKNPELKEKYSDNEHKQGGITVNISVPSPLAPPTIDITPED